MSRAQGDQQHPQHHAQHAGNHTHQPHRGGAGRAARASAAGGETYASAGLREHARHEALLLARTAHPGHGLPEFVHTYYALLPLELGAARVPVNAPRGVHVYKARSSTDGAAAMLLRVAGAPPAASLQMVRAAEAWRRVRHAAIVELRELFSTRLFNAAANEVIVAYAFPGRAQSLQAVFLLPHRPAVAPLPQDALWALTTQLLSAVAAAHQHGLACRGALDPTCLLVTGRNRVVLFGVGLADAFDVAGADHVPPAGATAPPMSGQAAERAAELRRLDLLALARVLLALALRANNGAVRNGILLLGAAPALDVLRSSAVYAPPFAALVETLLAGAAHDGKRTIDDALAVAAPRLSMELGAALSHADSLRHNLYDEFEAARHFRLLTLLTFVVERGGGGVEQSWAETGDRYLLQLFRDYVFHRVDANRAPLLDVAHVVECLARLDVGSPEQVLLASRDNSSLLVATYEELRRCLNSSINDLLQAGARSAALTRSSANANSSRSGAGRGATQSRSHRAPVATGARHLPQRF